MLVLFAIIAITIRDSSSSSADDNRCYLENGGSAESFFVSEDLPVGSPIGSLRIRGDASEGGNIELHLKEVLQPPVAILPFTKNLTLTRTLDKEGVVGPASVLVTVVCERKRTLDPGFLIPVNIRVTDANDNAPQFIGAPYLLNVSEVTVVGTRVIQGIRAVDADQQGPFSTVQYSILKHTPYWDYFSFANQLEGTLVLRKPLDFETLPNFTIRIRAQDQGNPAQFSETSVMVNVLDADDQNPKFTHDRYYAFLPEPSKRGVGLRVQPAEISAYDQDFGIRSAVYYSFDHSVPHSAAAAASSTHPDGVSSGSSESGVGLFEVNRANGVVTLASTFSPHQLQQPVTLVLRATQYDNADRYALATLTVSRRHNNWTPSPTSSAIDFSVNKQQQQQQQQQQSEQPQAEPLRFLHQHYHAAVLESVPVHTVVLTLLTNQPHLKGLKYWLSGGRQTAALETFAVESVEGSARIVVRQPLDYETLDNYQFIIHAQSSNLNAENSETEAEEKKGRSGVEEEAAANVNITVVNVNDWDPRFRYPQYEFYVRADESSSPSSPVAVGSVEAADGDRDDRLLLSLTGTPYASLFSIDDETGEIKLMDKSSLNSSTVHLIAMATDSGVPPRQASVPVMIHFSDDLLSLWRSSSSAGDDDNWLLSSSTNITKNVTNTTSSFAFFFFSVLFLLILISLLVLFIVMYAQKKKALSGRGVSRDRDGGGRASGDSGNRKVWNKGSNQFGELLLGSKRKKGKQEQSQPPVFGSRSNVHNPIFDNGSASSRAAPSLLSTAIPTCITTNASSHFYTATIKSSTSKNGLLTSNSSGIPPARQSTNVSRGQAPAPPTVPQTKLTNAKRENNDASNSSSSNNCSSDSSCGSNNSDSSTGDCSQVNNKIRNVLSTLDAASKSKLSWHDQLLVQQPSSVYQSRQLDQTRSNNYMSSSSCSLNKMDANVSVTPLMNPVCDSSARTKSSFYQHQQQQQQQQQQHSERLNLTVYF